MFCNLSTGQIQSQDETDNLACNIWATLLPPASFTPALSLLQALGHRLGDARAGGCVGIGQDITARDSPCYDFVTGPSAAEYRRIAALTDAGIANEVATHPQPPPE